MQEKGRQGIWPTKTPLGYRNVAGPDGKRIIASDPDLAPIVSKLFEWYATASIRCKMRHARPGTRASSTARAAPRLPVSAVHSILRNRL